MFMCPGVPGPALLSQLTVQKCEQPVLHPVRAQRAAHAAFPPPNPTLTCCPWTGLAALPAACRAPRAVQPLAARPRGCSSQAPPCAPLPPLLHPPQRCQQTWAHQPLQHRHQQGLHAAWRRTLCRQEQCTARAFLSLQAEQLERAGPSLRITLGRCRSAAVMETQQVKGTCFRCQRGKQIPGAQRASSYRILHTHSH